MLAFVTHQKNYLSIRHCKSNLKSFFPLITPMIVTFEGYGKI